MVADPSYGGGWVTGSSDIYDSSVILRQSVDNGEPVIFVSLNYRLGVFGWPLGKEAGEAGATNLGLRDVIKALEWVKANIKDFGGDPNKVTIAGESAGAAIVSNLLLQENTDLFRGAIMESAASGAPVAKPEELWQEPFNHLLDNAGCSQYIGANGTGAFDCLRRLTGDQLLAAQNKVQLESPYFFTVSWPFNAAVDGDLIKDYPHKLFQQGRTAKVPFIAGNNKDE